MLFVAQSIVLNAMMIFSKMQWPFTNVIWKWLIYVEKNSNILLAMIFITILYKNSNSDIDLKFVSLVRSLILGRRLILLILWDLQRLKFQKTSLMNAKKSTFISFRKALYCGTYKDWSSKRLLWWMLRNLYWYHSKEHWKS